MFGLVLFHLPQKNVWYPSGWIDFSCAKTLILFSIGKIIIKVTLRNNLPALNYTFIYPNLTKTNNNLLKFQKKNVFQYFFRQLKLCFQLDTSAKQEVEVEPDFVKMRDSRPHHHRR